MGEKSRGPEPPGAKGCLGGSRGSVISQKSQSVNQPTTDSRDAQQPQRKIFSFTPPDAPLAVLRAENAVLRAENALVVRVFRRLPLIHDRQGGRSLSELTFQHAEIHGDLAGLDALTADWLALGDPDWLRATGADQFVTEWTIDIAPGSRRR